MRGFRVPLVLWTIAIVEVVLAFVASVAGWPAQLGTDGTSPDGAVQWLIKGTAMSAPLMFLIVVGIVGFLATRDGVVGAVADVLALLLAAFTVVASMGEALAPDPVTTPRAVLRVSGAVGSAFAGIIIWAVVHDWRLRRRVTVSGAR